MPKKNVDLLSRISIAAVFLLLAACQTDGPKDIAGKKMSFGKIEVVPVAELHIHFVGDGMPAITKARRRMRDNSVTLEIATLDSDSIVRKSRVMTETTALIFNARSNNFLRDAEEVMKYAKRDFSTAHNIEIREGVNSKGDFVYALATYGTEDKCVYAGQGLRTKVSSIPGATYDTIGYFTYCSRNKTESEILAIFDNLQFREDN